MMSVTTLVPVCARTARHSFRTYHRIAAAIVSTTPHSCARLKLLLTSSSLNRPGYLLEGAHVQSRPFTTRPHPTVDKVIRVDHAGEYGADRIYAGQAAILGKTEVGHVIEHMWNQEKAHLELFNTLVRERRVRPTVLLPLWDIAGFVLGAGTALLGKEAAMACTVAVEEVIGDHYNSQLRELLDTKHGDEKLLEGISKCRDDELEHRDIGLRHNAKLAPAYEGLSQVIKTGCRAAIWLSERI